jgi:hypothetical protein
VANPVVWPAEYGESELAGRQAGRQLRVICRLLKFGRLFPRCPADALTRDRRLRQERFTIKTCMGKS